MATASVIQLRHAIRPLAFWPPMLAMVLVALLAASSTDDFIALTETLNSMVINGFSRAFTGSAFCLLLLCLGIYLSPAGAIVIGGEKAQRLYTPFRWFAVSLTTVIAIGILFWSVAEPVLHFNNPPDFAGVLARTDGAASFAFATLLVHWGPAPYAIYTSAALGFALAHHNLNGPFASRTLLASLVGQRIHGHGGQLIDALVLLAAVVGMAAGLTAGTLLIGEGIARVGGQAAGTGVYALVIGGILGAALISSYTGLQRGIQWLARVNTLLFVMAIAALVVVAPIGAIADIAVSGLAEYVDGFVERHLLWQVEGDWPGWWTVAFFASWFAWAPVSCLFLGKIAVGYTVRQFILVNLVLPSVFAFFWFAVFGGFALEIERSQQGLLFNAFQQRGLGAVVYPLFEQVGGGLLMVGAFITIAVISFITATDSNAEVIGGLCLHTDSHLTQAKKLLIKAVWIATIGLLAWLSVSFLGDKGIKVLANLAGLPGLIIVDLAAVALLVTLFRLKKQGG